MADCLFCSITAGTTPAQIVLDTPEVVGFLDVRPVFKGHTLIVPREHIPTLVELPDELMVPFFGAARSVAAAVRTAFDAQGSPGRSDMTATESLTSPPPASAMSSWGDAAPGAGPVERRTFREILDDVLPVIGVVVVAGPPVVFLAAPWLLLALMLSGPFALLVAFVVAGLVAAALLVTLAGILAAPFVVARRLRRRYRASQVLSVPAPQVATLHAPRVAA